MGRLSEFCTCTYTNCPHHPRNHDEGCSKCIEKNLRQREIPYCFFLLLDGVETREGDSFESFAKLVMKQGK